MVSRGIFAIVNPAAGGGRCGRAWPAWIRRLEADGVPVTALATTAPGEATRLTREALRGGANTVVAVGGDGTVNEVVNGFFDGDALIDPQARLGVIPMGTGGDLARGLGLRGRAAIDALGPKGRTGTIDVGRVRFVAHGGHPECRYFVNGGDLGIGGETAAYARRGPKALGGLAAYLVAATRAILRHQSHAVSYSIDGAPSIAARIDTIFVTNGPYTGGGMLVAPTASLDDGLLDVLVLRAVGKPTLLLRLLPGIYRGTHVRHPAVQHLRARRVAVEAEEPLLLQLDGEQPGTSPAEFTVCPRILPVALPPAYGPVGS